MPSTQQDPNPEDMLSAVDDQSSKQSSIRFTENATRVLRFRELPLSFLR
jgi:hypothetical protein